MCAVRTLSCTPHPTHEREKEREKGERERNSEREKEIERERERGSETEREKGETEKEREQKKEERDGHSRGKSDLLQRQKRPTTFYAPDDDNVKALGLRENLLGGKRDLLQRQKRPTTMHLTMTTLRRSASGRISSGMMISADIDRFIVSCRE
jgi:hypothetical protein